MNQERIHPQDWALIAEALAQFAGNPNELETPREWRAWVLVEAIADDQGLAPSELIRQIDDDWSGPD